MSKINGNNRLDSEVGLNLDWLAYAPQEKVLGHDIDFLVLFDLVRQKNSVCYMFESISHPRHQDRFHVLGFDPALQFVAREDSLTVSGREDVMEKTLAARVSSHTFSGVNPYRYLAESIVFDRLGKTHQGGLIGYLSHEAMNYFEDGINLEEHPEFEPFRVGLYLDGVILDVVTQTLTYYTYGEDRSDYVLDLISQISPDGPLRKPVTASYLGDSVTREEFISKTLTTKKKICEGYSFQTEVGMKSFFEVKGDKFTVYQRLREINPSPYMFFVKFGEQEMFGASPEILISCKNNRILTTPTAGTTKRGEDAADDVRLARALLSDEKEIAEHNMLVDLHRNDVSRVSEPGTVVVEDLMYVIKFSHVQHIVSNVVGIKARDKNSFDVLEAILPGGVVTGAPKIETVKIIDENEGQPRGPYGGAVGRFSLNGDCDFCLPIRSLFCHGDTCFAQTSAGVVYDSRPEHEYEEIQRKLSAMKSTLAEFGAN